MKRDDLSLSHLAAKKAILIALLAGGAVAPACSNDNAEPTRPPPIGDDDASTGSGGKGSGGAGTGATSGKDSGTGGDEASGGSGGGGAVTDGGGGTSGDASPSAGGNPATGGAGGDAGPECDPTETGDHPKACFPCKPSKTVEFLNHCTTSDCQPFDNPGKLGAANWNDGKLIPLP